MRLERGILAISLAVGLALAATPALACNCPKEAMLKLYGTVSMVPPDQAQGAQKPAPVPVPAFDPLAPQVTGASTPPAGQTTAPAANPPQ